MLIPDSKSIHGMNFLRTIQVIVLSLAVIYGGVAQAFETCSVDWGHSDRSDISHSTHRTTIMQSGTVGNLPHGSPSVIHCLEFNLQIGPMMETSRIRITGSSNYGVNLQWPVASAAGILFSWANHYHPKLFSYRPSSISIPATSPFRVFLSVFQI